MKKPRNCLANLLLLILSSCTTAPPDFMACADLGDKGHCVTYLSKKKSDPTGDEWRRLRAGSVLMPSKEFVKVKTWFDVYCHKNDCPNNVGDWSSFAKELAP